MIVVDAIITVWCERVGREEFRAQFFDRTTSQFYGGSGANALEAVAWALDEYIARAVHGVGPMMARRADAWPGERWGGPFVDFTHTPFADRAAPVARLVEPVRDDTRIEVNGPQFVGASTCAASRNNVWHEPATCRLEEGHGGDHEAVVVVDEGWPETGERRRIAWDVYGHGKGNEILSAPAAREVGCFDVAIPRAEAPSLLGEKTKTAATRRNTARKAKA